MTGALADIAALSGQVSFQDGLRYAVIDPASMTLGVTLAAPDDHPAPGQVVLSAKADHVKEAVDELTTAGAEVLHGPEQGPHEVRSLVRLAGGLLLSVYGPEL